MYGLLLQLHSVFRWLVIILLFICLFRAVISCAKRNNFRPADAVLNKYLLIVTHIQFLLGVFLYFISPSVKLAMSNFKMAMKVNVLRYWAVEHALTMLITVALITIGYVVAKRKPLAISKYRSLTVYYFIAFLLIIATVPWPFKEVGRPWI